MLIYLLRHGQTEYNAQKRYWKIRRQHKKM